MDSERIPWSQAEVELTVADYFTMLDCELRGQKYSKAERRRELLKLLNKRPNGAVEFKHQNISAVLLELGLPYIDGYKPRRNYQELLKSVVLEWISLPARVNRFTDAADDPVTMPELPDNVDNVLVPIPKALPKPVSEKPDMPRVGRRIDYARREASNRSLGRQGEEFVLSWETERLRRHGRDDLARKVEWVSEVQGDGLGFDIASFDVQTDQPIAIEVKTTRGGQYNPFFVTRNEAEVSQEMTESYRLYRLYRFAIEPRLFIVPGPLDASLILEPYTYRATFRQE
ncbi:DUF3883 domain-containing protein [Armatimonas sp.]|uniref:DUF3883 domain-containing protein n=1 Tax=Armatimonas sp. TaxID=1872638 RepID=UPI0037524E5B